MDKKILASILQFIFLFTATILIMQYFYNLGYQKGLNECLIIKQWQVPYQQLNQSILLSKLNKTKAFPVKSIG